MIYCLYGQETYRSKEELRKIVEEYKKSRLDSARQANPDWLDFIKIDADDKEIETFQALRQTADTVSMFSQNKLIIVENIFSSNADVQNEILEFLKKRDIEKNNSIVLAFWDEEIDAKSGLFKYLKSEVKCEEFKLLGKAQLRSWIKNYIVKQGGNIDIQAIDKLVEYIGSDLWRMENEINKLISFKHQAPSSKTQTIKVEDVELLIRPEIDLNIFELGDAIGQKNKTKAIKLFNQQIDEGKNEFYLLSMITNQIRNLIKVKTTPQSKLGLHPFVFQKSSQQAKNFTFEELKKIYRQLMTIDFESKIGKTDIKTSLELFISGL